MKITVYSKTMKNGTRYDAASIMTAQVSHFIDAADMIDNGYKAGELMTRIYCTDGSTATYRAEGLTVLFSAKQ